MPSEAFIALTIKVTDTGDDKRAANRWASELSGAISTMLQTGGNVNVHTSVTGVTEAMAVKDLAKYVQADES